MKKLLSVIILSFIAIGNTALAEDPVFEMQPLIEPIQIEQIKFEPMPLYPEDENIEEDVFTDDPALMVHLEFNLLEDGRPELDWTRYNGPEFLYYKILHDQDDPNLYYPEFGYIAYFEDQNATHFVWDEKLPVGDNFMRVCVITTDNRRGCSNTVSHFMPQAFYENLQKEKEMQIEEHKEDIIDKPVLTEEQIQKLKDQNNNNGKSFNFLTWLWNNLGVILTIIAVILAATGFTFAAKRKQKSISKYMNQIDDTYSEYKMKAKRCEAELYRLKDIVDNELKSGKIDDGAYQLLLGRIEGYMIDIQKQIVNEKFGGLPSSLKDEMFKMMEDGEITESEFDAMQKLIKRSELSATEQDSLLAQIKDFKKQDDVMKRKRED
jgi:hypothetical protein